MCDVSKAFNTVPDSLLLAKLNELGLDPYLQRWIKNYLTNRSQCACVDVVGSHHLVFAASISSNSDVNMFADDIALYWVIKTTTDIMFIFNRILTLHLPAFVKKI